MQKGVAEGEGLGQQGRAIKNCYEKRPLSAGTANITCFQNCQFADDMTQKRSRTFFLILL